MVVMQERKKERGVLSYMLLIYYCSTVCAEYSVIRLNEYGVRGQETGQGRSCTEHIN